jgi:WD repeat-containing protein 55
LTSAYVTGFSQRGTNVGTKIIAGDATGVLNLWEKGVYDDQDERIVMSRMLTRFDAGIFPKLVAEDQAESVECMANIPTDIVGNERAVAVGLSGGLVALLQLGSGGHKVIDVVRHHEAESAEKVGFDVYGRIITGGGPVIKVWREKKSAFTETEEEDGNEDSNSGTTDDESEGEDSESESEKSESESEDERPKKKRKGGPSMGFFPGLD